MLSKLPVSPKHLRNFVYGDCLKDWLELYRPLPLLVRSNRLSTNSTKRSRDVLSTMTRSSCTVGDNNFQTFVDAVLSTSDLQQTFPTFRPITMTYKKPCNVYVVIAVGSQQHQAYKTYVKVKKVMAKTLYALNHNVPFDSIGMLEYNVETGLKDVYVDEHQTQVLINSACEWIERVHTEGLNWSIDGEYPPHVCMMPNLSLVDADQYTSLRLELAWKWKEIGLLYFVGAATRNKLHNHNVYTLNHPKFFDLLTTLTSFPQHLSTQQVMLRDMFKPIEPARFEWNFQYRRLNGKNADEPLRAYLDLENTCSPTGEVIVNVIGVFYELIDMTYNFKTFASKDDSCVSECHSWLQEHLPNHIIVHYTSADKPAIPLQAQTEDLYDPIRSKLTSSQSLQALCLHNFKLKSVYERLSQRLSLPNLYKGLRITNGLQAMHALERWIDNGEETCLEDVVVYNKVDCIALALLDVYMACEENNDPYVLNGKLYEHVKSLTVDQRNKQQQEQTVQE